MSAQNTPHALPGDPLRPVSLNEFAGQPDVVRELSIVLAAAVSREEPPPHILFSGPPGLGKTTLAGIIANQTKLPIVATSAPALTAPGDLISLLVGLTAPSVLFVDEIHQLPRVVEETLYTAMEDGRVDIIMGSGAASHAVGVPLTPFTLVGATTRVGSLGAPFRDRFGYIGRLSPYDEVTLSTIIHRSSKLLGLTLTDEAAGVIASRSRGTPRVANRLLSRVRDFHSTQENPDAIIDKNLTLAACEAFGVDQAGLDSVDRMLLTALCEDFNGGPVGLSTLATVIGETDDAVASVHEPYLMKSGFMARTGRGRVAFAKAYTHLGLSVPIHLQEDTQEKLEF